MEVKMNRKEFIKATAVTAAAIATVPSSGLFASEAQQTVSTGKIGRGVSIFSYSGSLNTIMTLEDIFADISDIGGPGMGLEILASHVEGYPNPTDKWVEWWWSMMDKYKLKPIEFGHWVDSKMYNGRIMTSQESFDQLAGDLRLAKKLGFTRTRTKIGVVDILLNPVPNWAEFMKMALPVAEECNIKMGTEIHQPTKVDDPFLFDTYINWIEKTGPQAKEWFGFVLDFGIFNQTPPKEPGRDPFRPSDPQKIKDILPYIKCCHGKFSKMAEDCSQELNIPYPEIIGVLQKGGYEGFILSEGGGTPPTDQLRKQHVMLKRLLGV
jgi:hypothetical protein